MSAPNCRECWGVLADFVMDAGVFGEKAICALCYLEHYSLRPIIGRFSEEEMSR